MYNFNFVPLNSTEIVIVGGGSVGHIVTFDTITCEFKKELIYRNELESFSNRSANVCENSIVALVEK